jgi:hypothetical protein
MDQRRGDVGTMPPSQTAGTRTGSDAGERLSASKDTAVEGAKDMLESGQEHVKELASVTVDQLRTVIDRTREEARTQAEEKAKRAAEGLRTASTQLRALADGRPAEAGQMRDLVSSLTDQLGQWASRLDGGMDGVMQDMGRFARRRPGAFLGLAALAGFAAGRLVRVGAHAQGTASTANGPRPMAATYSRGTPATSPERLGGADAVPSTPGLPGQQAEPARTPEGGWS